MPPESPPSLTILLVEDEPDLREAVGEALRDAGHRPVGVDTVERAHEVLAGFAVDVVMLDLFMNDGTSEPLLVQLAGRVTTLLTSADATERSRAIAAKYGVPLLLKPFDLDALLPALLHAHEERRSRSSG